MMHDVMTGMFWAGVVMALPPVAMTIGVAIYIYRHHRGPREDPAERTTAGD
jgi:hypothetical protein